uniref:Cytochrome b-c1 complex subunit 8 n=1 Tax=Acrobeloides nanus TaxID=290746 RepID=A0A914CV77_9BILA
MRISPVACHRHFGNLVKVHGQYSFSLAPNEQKAFTNWGKGLYNQLNRHVLGEWHIITFNLIGYYLLFDYAKKKFATLERKIPQDFENEVIE